MCVISIFVMDNQSKVENGSSEIGKYVSASVSVSDSDITEPLDFFSLQPMLERFERIYLWMDDDVPGREGAEQFSKKIGIDRCLLVRPTMLTMNERRRSSHPPRTQTRR